MKGNVRLLPNKPGYSIEIDDACGFMTSIPITKKELIALYLVIKDEAIRVGKKI